ncbi:MAG: hypothetical protein QW607_10830 [Desulfurococcaceae archaeon]
MKFYAIERYHCHEYSLGKNWAKFIAVAKDYFPRGIAYSDEIGPKDWRSSIFVYCAPPPEGSIACQNCPSNGEKVLKFRLDCEVPNSFYDYKGPVGLCYKIVVNDIIAGEYCLRNKVLFLSDWIYYDGFIDKACELLRTVCNVLNLRKRIVKPSPNEERVRIQIGADVEFEELADWEDYYPVRTSIARDLKGEIGTDGSGDQIELRPQPALTAKELVRNIRRLIGKLSCPISVLGDRYPLGAHIHFELPERLIKHSIVVRICEVLDEFLGKQLIGLSGSARGQYRELTAYRLKEWGFEYRTLPSAILLNPKIARIVFKIAKNVVEYFINHKAIELNNELTYWDYRKYAKLTKTEYETFIEFIRSYWISYTGLAINDNWVKKRRNSMKLLFYDEWDSDVIEYVKSKFSNPYWKGLLNGRTIVFYGLHKNRGLVVAGFDCPGYTRIEHVISKDCDFLFGLPRIVRVKEENWSKEELDKVIKAIKGELKKRLKGGE